MFNEDCESKKGYKFNKKRLKDIDKHRKKYQKALKFVTGLETNELRNFYFALQYEINARTD